MKAAAASATAAAGSASAAAGSANEAKEYSQNWSALDQRVTKNANDIVTTNNNLSNANSQITQLYSDMQAKNSPYAENTSGASYGLPDYSYVLGNAGNKKGTASGDVYYIAVDAKGGLYGGAQVNNAIVITWEKTATKNELDKNSLIQEHNLILYQIFHHPEVDLELIPSSHTI